MNNSSTFELTPQTIAKGPAYVERMMMSSIGNVDNNTQETKYCRIIEQLKTAAAKTNKIYLYILNFYLGNFYEQAARNASNKNNCIEYLTNARIHYLAQLKLHNEKTEDTYYAQMQLGHIALGLGEPWAEAEEAFLKAFQIDPERGEPLDQIIRHYFSTGEYTIAYIYSSYAKDVFFNKVHTQRRVWGFDNNLYNWTVLDLHIAVCYQLGGVEEASQAFSLLLNHCQTRPDLFNEYELKHIHSKRSLFTQIEA